MSENSKVEIIENLSKLKCRFTERLWGWNRQLVKNFDQQQQ